MLVKPHLTFNLKLKLSRMKKAHYKINLDSGHSD